MNIRKLIISAAALSIASTMSGCSFTEALYGESSEYSTFSDLMNEKEKEQTTDQDTTETEEAAELTFINQTEIKVNAENAPAYVENASEVYKNIEYSPEMFFGKYIKAGANGTQLPPEEAQKFAAEMAYMECSSFDVPVTVLPYRIEAGTHTNVTAMNYLTGHNFMNLYFCSQDGTRQSVQASYTVRGNTLQLNPIKSFDYDSEANQLDYSFSGKNLKYTFEFKGPVLTLSTGKNSVKLYAEDLFTDSGVELTECSVKEGTEKFSGIEALNFNPDSQNYIKFSEKENRDVDMQLCEDGICKLRWADASGETTCQLAYFYCGDDGIVLSDGEKNYYYTSRSWDIYTQNVSANLTFDDAKKLQEMDTEKVEEIVNKSDDLYTDLQTAFDNAGIGAYINRETGEIALDSLVLFSSESDVVTDEGADFINRFLSAYTSVIFNEKYDGFIKTVTVEGHTDTNGSYEYNEELSQKRAESVRNYCLSGESGLDQESLDKLSGMLEAVGYSYDKPILNEDGTVNMQASRRVSFRFIINISE